MRRQKVTKCCGKFSCGKFSSRLKNSSVPTAGTKSDNNLVKTQLSMQPEQTTHPAPTIMETVEIDSVPSWEV